MNKEKLDRFIQQYAAFGTRRLKDDANRVRMHVEHVINGFYPITDDELVKLTAEHAPKHKYDDPDTGQPQFSAYGFARDLLKGLTALMEKKGEQQTYNIPTKVWIEAFGNVSLAEVEHELKMLRTAHLPWFEADFRKEVTEHVMNNVDSLNDVDDSLQHHALLNRFLRGFDSIFRRYLDGKFPGHPKDSTK